MQIFETLRLRLSLVIVRRRTHVVAVFTLFLLTLVGTWGLLRNGNVIGAGAATQYYPWYSFLGESLRSGEVPGWNPYQFSGVPFTAHPLPGWAYLPVMLLCTFLPLVAAAESFVLLHLLLAGLSTYALASTLGMGVPGALLAAVAYEFSSFLYLQTVWCFTYVAVMSWLPLAFLSAELAVRSLRWPGRLSWWGCRGWR